MEPVEPRDPLSHRKRTSLQGSLVSRQHRVSLCETLDRVLNKGAVIAGDIIISIADVDLLYIGLNLMVTSVETMQNWAVAEPVADGGLLPAPVREPCTPAEGEV